MRRHIRRKRALFAEMEKLVELLERQQKAWATTRQGEEYRSVSRLQELHQELEEKHG